jgi:hypothetical protein
MQYSRRQFIALLGVGAALALTRQTFAADWDHETPLAKSVRDYLQGVIGGRKMALDFRRINSENDEEFRIQINAVDYYPVASCFKAFAVLYYFLNTPPDVWDNSEYTPVYRAAVYSNNAQTGVLLDDVARRVPGRGNAIEKFNDFLHDVVGIDSGLHTWNWETSPTTGMSDERFAPGGRRTVRIRDQVYNVDNVFTAEDLARGYDLLARGEAFSRSDRMRQAIDQTRRLLSIRAPDYQSPIERVYKAGYMGKDGVLPASDVATGRVIADAGVVSTDEAQYIIAFMAAGESESTAVWVLSEVIGQIQAYENGLKEANAG